MDEEAEPLTRSRAEWKFQELAWVFLNKALPHGTFVIGIDEAAKRSKSANLARKRRGCNGGVGDLYVYSSRITLFLECKDKGGSHQTNQKAFRDGVLRNGGHYTVVKTLEDVEAACLHAGIPLRATLGDIRTRIAEQNERLPAKKKSGRRPSGPLNQMSLSQYRNAHAKGQL